MEKEDILIELANLEKIGATLLVIGYSLFVVGANIDVTEILEIDENGPKATTVTLNGAEIVLIGYVVLWIVAEKRLMISQETNNETVYPYKKLAYSYILSILANSLRVQALGEIDVLNASGIVFA